MKKIMTIFVIGLLSSCSAKLMMPSQADVDRVSNKYPGYTLTELNEGKMHYEQKCSTCHGLKKPKSHTEAQWSEIVPRMVKKANKKTEVIDPKTQESILKYLVTMSTASKK